MICLHIFFFSCRTRHTSWPRDWSSDVCSSDLRVLLDDNDPPPANVQQDPPVGVAHRTSPTNIGLALLANLAAYDFGYVVAEIGRASCREREQSKVGDKDRRTEKQR